MIREDNASDTNILWHFMKWTVSFWRTAKWGGKAGRFYGIKKKNKEETNRKCFIGWGHVGNFVWGEKAQSWLGVWRLTIWIHCISGQAEHLQGQDSYLSVGLLMWHFRQEQLHLGSRKLFQQSPLLILFLTILLDQEVWFKKMGLLEHIILSKCFDDWPLGGCKEGGPGLLGFWAWSCCSCKATSLVDFCLKSCGLLEWKGNSDRGLVEWILK